MKENELINRDRIMVSGLSLGTEYAMVLAVLDPDIKALVFNDQLTRVVQRAASFTKPNDRGRRPVVNWLGCFFPGIWGWFDFPDLLAAVAPQKQAKSYIFQPVGNPVTVNSGRINWVARDPEWKDIKGFRGENDVENVVGEWNKLKCIVAEGEIYIFLNDILVNHATHVKPSKGRLQIQSEGAEVFIRKIELTPIQGD